MVSNVWGTLRSPTVISFPNGSLSEQCTIQAILAVDDTYMVVMDRSPYHPTDPWWSDQPGDVGSLRLGASTMEIIDSRTVVETADGVIWVGPEVPPKRADDSRLFVGHVLHAPSSFSADDLIGQKVLLEVHARRRQRLGAAHSRSHLFAIALNATLAPLWSKPVLLDSRGSPDFDRLAISSSRIDEGGSTEIYRLGKSIRKKGLDISTLGARLEPLIGAATEQVNQWISLDVPIEVTTGQELELTSRRSWACDLPGGRAEIPCGSTHVARTGLLGTLAVTPEWNSEAQTLTLQLKAQE